MSSSAVAAGPPVIVLGGTGFVGRALAAGWSAPTSPRFLVHRTMPAWLEQAGIETVRVDLEDTASLRATLNDGGTLINLIRPDGKGWYPRLVERLMPAARQSAIVRVVHASSIDVYSGATAPLVDEDTPVHPISPYEREHCEVEGIISARAPGAVILRLGAVFGPGGRNVASFANEFAHAAYLKLALRRALYGKRRMHLVSIDAVVQALIHFACRSDYRGIVTVTQDDDPDNNFAFLQDVLAEAFGRRPLDKVPALPPAVLRLALRWRGLNPAMATRRFSAARSRVLGLDTDGFSPALRRYAHELAAQHRAPIE